MPYNNAIPQPTDQLNQSQNDILNNFIEIDNFVNTDHGPFNGVTQGMHVKVSLPVGPNPPTNPFAANANGFFCANGGHVPGIRQTYGRIQVQGPANRNIPFTESILATNAAPAANATGWTYLPSGILLKWGIFNVPNGGPTNLNVNAAGTFGPNYTQIFMVQATGSTSFATGAITVTFAAIPNISFTNTTGGARNAYWLTIGI